MTDDEQPTASIIPFDGLEHSRHSHEFVGAERGDVPFSIILVHSQPGVGPKLHRHPYAEVFIVEAGEATFRIGDETVVVTGGNVVVSPPGEAHGFTNTGTDELRLTAIHGSGRFETEWLDGPDPTWASTPRTAPRIAASSGPRAMEAAGQSPSATMVSPPKASGSPI